MTERESQYLSYSGWKAYDPSVGGCPMRYKFIYIDNIKIKRDPRSSIFGSSIGTVFEWFYEKKFWDTRDPTATTLQHAKKAVSHVLKKEKYSPDREFIVYILQEMEKYIPPAVETIKKYKLLDEHSKAEFKLNVTYGNKNYDFNLLMGGTADFLHGRLEPILLDGKAYADREKYADTEQLIWYASQHFLKFRVAPARLGFLYYKFPENPIDWVDYNEHDIRRCVKKAYDAAKSIRLKMFQPHPTNKCKTCEFTKHCSEGQKFIEAMSFNNETITSDNTILDIEQA